MASSFDRRPFSASSPFPASPHSQLRPIFVSDDLEAPTELTPPPEESASPVEIGAASSSPSSSSSSPSLLPLSTSDVLFNLRLATSGSIETSEPSSSSSSSSSMSSFPRDPTMTLTMNPSTTPIFASGVERSPPAFLSSPLTPSSTNRILDRPDDVIDVTLSTDDDDVSGGVLKSKLEFPIACFPSLSTGAAALSTRTSFSSLSRGSSSSLSRGLSSSSSCNDDDDDDDLRPLSWLAGGDLLNRVPIMGGGSGVGSSGSGSAARGASIPQLGASNGRALSPLHQHPPWAFPHPPHVPYDPHIHAIFKPPYSFTSLIFMAIETCPEKRMQVREIYSWLANHFPYFRSPFKKGWKNSIRHNLSLNKSFGKVETEVGKSSYWIINAPFRDHLVESLKKAPLHCVRHLASLGLRQGAAEWAWQPMTSIEDGGVAVWASTSPSEVEIKEELDSEAGDASRVLVEKLEGWSEVQMEELQAARGEEKEEEEEAMVTVEEAAEVVLGDDDDDDDDPTPPLRAKKPRRRRLAKTVEKALNILEVMTGNRIQIDLGLEGLRPVVFEGLEREEAGPVEAVVEERVVEEKVVAEVVEEKLMVDKREEEEAREVEKMIPTSVDQPSLIIDTSPSTSEPATLTATAAAAAAATSAVPAVPAARVESRRRYLTRKRTAAERESLDQQDQQAGVADSDAGATDAAPAESAPADRIESRDDAGQSSRSRDVSAAVAPAAADASPTEQPRIKVTMPSPHTCPFVAAARGADINAAKVRTTISASAADARKLVETRGRRKQKILPGEKRQDRRAKLQQLRKAPQPRRVQQKLKEKLRSVKRKINDASLDTKKRK